MKRILVITPEDQSSNAFWRSVGPMNYLAKWTEHEIQVDHFAFLNTANLSLNWSQISRYDLVFLHRPCADSHLKVMQMCWTANVPVWIDYDDWLFGLPAWNPNGTYHQHPVQLAMAQALACADYVSCTTVELYNAFKAVNQNTVLLPNAYRSDLYPHRIDNPLPPRHKDNFMVWRGSNTHAGDLLSVKDAWKELPFNIRFIGDVDWLTIGQVKPERLKLLGGYDTMVYPRVLYDMFPTAMVFPLVDCFFNRCKSNIAWIEALHAGALCVAPDLPEWNRDGCINYKPHDAQDFLRACKEVMEMDTVLRAERVQLAFHKMRESLDIKVISNIRYQMVKEATHPEYRKTGANPFDQSVGLPVLAKMQEINKIQHAQTTKV